MPVVIEVLEKAFRRLPAATLDESRAPELAVVTRFTDGRMLRGTIERNGERWLWHFVLDSVSSHEGCAGVASSYALARDALCEGLKRYNVTVVARRDSLLPRLQTQSVLKDETFGSGKLTP